MAIDLGPDGLTLGSTTVNDWADVGGGKVLGISSIYHTTTSTTYNAAVTRLGSLNIYYIDAAKRSATYTKQSSSSVLLVHFGYSFRRTGANAGLHSFLIFKDSSTYQIVGHDIDRDGNGPGMIQVSGTQPFTGLSTGSHTFNMVPARSNSSTAAHGINGSAYNDQPTPTSSYIYIMEVET
jgi:hypothetical protein